MLLLLVLESDDFDFEHTLDPVRAAFMGLIHIQCCCILLIDNLLYILLGFRKTSSVD